MGSIYVMSDIHGEYYMFTEMLKKINFTKKDRLIVLGDVLDRGKYPIKTLVYIMESENIEMIMGNHEKIFLDYLSAEEKMGVYELYIQNGGYFTLFEYLKLDETNKKKVVDYLKKLPLYKVIGQYILVHAGIKMSQGKKIDKQNVDFFLWAREDFYLNKATNKYKVIFGHTPTTFIRKDKKFMIWHDETYNDKINIDCGATFKKAGGKLACLRLDDMKEFYVRKI